MSRSQLILCLFGISAAFFNRVEARVKSFREPRILGGHDAIEGQFPYQISLESDGKSICGGSILSERFVITAAHCVLDKDNNSFENLPLKVVAGIADLNSWPNSRIAVDVVQVFVPKEYDVRDDTRYTSATGDIAILKLKRDLDLRGDSKLSKVKLPKKGEIYDGKRATVTGFGFNYIEVGTNEKGEIYDIGGKAYGKMRFAEAIVVSDNDCNKFNPTRPIKKSHICAAVVQHNEDESEGVCSGDSGGPLVYEDVQIGVVSVGPPGCAEEIKPAVYTRVSEYLNFIDKAVKGKIDETIRTTTLKGRNE